MTAGEHSSSGSPVDGARKDRDRGACRYGYASALRRGRTPIEVPSRCRAGVASQETASATVESEAQTGPRGGHERAAYYSRSNDPASPASALAN